VVNRDSISEAQVQYIDEIYAILRELAAIAWDSETEMNIES